MTPDQLNDLRLKKAIFGTKFGCAWHFKMDEIQRFADDRGIALESAEGNTSVSDLMHENEFLKSDDNFDLTPLQDIGFKDTSSSSQVIPLKDSQIYKSGLLGDIKVGIDWEKINIPYLRKEPVGSELVNDQDRVAKKSDSDQGGSCCLGCLLVLICFLVILWWALMATDPRFY